MHEIRDYLFKNYYGKYRGKEPIEIPSVDQVDQAIKFYRDHVVIIHNNGITGVGIFVTLSDKTYENLENLDLKDADTLIKIVQETGDNVHFILIATEGFKNIMLLGEEVKKIMKPKTVSWWNPEMTKLHKYKLGG